MAHGFKTGGRVKGVSLNKRTKEQLAAVGKGETPLAYMLRVMHDPSAEYPRRDDMARAAAPYIHAKLAAIEHSGPDGGPLQVTVARFTDTMPAISNTAVTDAESEEGS